jgi:DNA invertase Pin-like site-specific DNA recombinase
MAHGRFVSYLRVSTDRQGKSGLGLSAQRKAVDDFLNGARWELIEELIEVESGKNDNRPKLAEALSRCRLHNATLVIAKLDRLSRDAHFLLGLQKAGVRFIAADMPEANEMVVGIMAVVAQAERKMISERTRAALAAAKAQGRRLGTPRNLRNSETGRTKSLANRRAVAKGRAADLLPILNEIAAGTVTLRQMAAELNRRRVPAARGGAWSAVQVKRVLLQFE